MQNLQAASAEDEIYIGVRESLGFFVCLFVFCHDPYHNLEVAESCGLFFFLS